MKKVLSLLLMVILVLSFTGCSAKTAGDKSSDAKVTAEVTQAVSEPTESTETATDKKYSVGFATLTTEGDFMALTAKELTDRFGKLGYTFEVASADMSATKQIEQIENFIVKGIDEIIVMAVDPSSLGDVLKKAQDKGIKILSFSQKTPVYDVNMSSDEPEVGKTCADMAAKWIDATFPDAAAGSIKVAILENRDKPTAADRSDGLAQIVNLTDKATIVKTVSVDTTTESSMAATENLLLTNPDINVILSYNGDTAMGVDSYVMSMNSPIKDKAHFGTFSVDYNPAAADAIKKSVNNESIWRGTVMMGSSLDQMFTDIIDRSVEVLTGTLKQKDFYSELFEITPENVDTYSK